MAGTAKVMLVLGLAAGFLPVVCTAQVMATPNHLDFGVVPLGTTAIRKVTIETAADVPVLGLRVVGAAYFFAVQPPSAAAAGEELSVWLTFQPTKAAPEQGELVGNDLVVTITGSGGPQAAPLNPSRPPSGEERVSTPADAPAPISVVRVPKRAAALTPKAPIQMPLAVAGAPKQNAPEKLEVDTSNALILLHRGQSSAQATVTVSNLNGVAVGSVVTPSGLPNIFDLSSDCPNHASGIDTCSITATASPDSTAYAGEEVDVLSPSGDVLAKTGFSVKKEYSIFSASAPSVDFGEVSVGDTTTKQISISNQGFGAASLTEKAPIPAGVSVSGCAGIISGTCIMDVSFSPTALGALTATIFLVPSDGGPSISLAVAGQGLPATPTISPATLSFTGAAGEQQIISVSNETSHHLAVNGVQIQGPFSDSNGCADGLAPGQACSISVEYDPSPADSGLASTGDVTVTTTAPLNIATVALNVAAHHVEIAVDQGALNLGIGQVGGGGTTGHFGVTNKGQLPAKLVVQSAGDFSATPECAELQPNTSCQVNVSFDPSAPGSRNGVAIVSDGRTSLTVGLSGVGVTRPPSRGVNVPLSIGSGFAGGLSFGLPSLVFGHSVNQANTHSILVSPSTLSIKCNAQGCLPGTLSIVNKSGTRFELVFVTVGPFDVTGCSHLPANSNCTAKVAMEIGQNVDKKGMVAVVNADNASPLAVVQLRGKVTTGNTNNQGELSPDLSVFRPLHPVQIFPADRHLWEGVFSNAFPAPCPMVLRAPFKPWDRSGVRWAPACSWTDAADGQRP